MKARCPGTGRRESRSQEREEGSRSSSFPYFFRMYDKDVFRLTDDKLHRGEERSGNSDGIGI